MGAEKTRLQENHVRQAYWQKWGPYVTERQWGTVREDYSQNGDAWNAFDFQQSHSRVYRWGEDGIAGICDTHQQLCFALTLWNGKDPILKEKLFGLSNTQGNHGEDVKECYYYLDNTPTHSYMKYLYKYPQSLFPYSDLIAQNAQRNQSQREYELLDTGVFNEDRYFDVFIEYAKVSPRDIFIYITVHNRGAEKARCHVIPTVLFRNTWSWDVKSKRPLMQTEQSLPGFSTIVCEKEGFDTYRLYGKEPQEMLFTENETNFKKLFGRDNKASHVKDGFHEYVVHGNKKAVNPENRGTKGAFHYVLDIEPKSSQKITLRLTKHLTQEDPLSGADTLYKTRVLEADEFYDEIISKNLTKEQRSIERQALSGMLWNKQFYLYPVDRWLKGDGKEPIVRNNSRNKNWIHLYSEDILSMPDKWEYPWFAAWDLAFHALPLSRVDPEFAKKQLSVITREWFMNPSGQLPAYEWNFSDVNPPVHAWACWRVYKIEQKATGQGDLKFLEAVFQKLLLNFTWWVNREDKDGRNVFQGGFLGLDNISVFNRSEKLPQGGELYQSDATSWMGMFAAIMLTIAIELVKTNPVYEDIASKFYLHFLYISKAINYADEFTPSLWNEEDGFYYDILMLPQGGSKQLKVKSLVGLMPLLAVMAVEMEDLQRMKHFCKRLSWFEDHRPELCAQVAPMKTPGVNGRRLVSIVAPDRLRKILKVLLDEKEFLSPYGIRSIAKSHGDHPYVLDVGDCHYSVDYEPGESTNKLFGGNSNWRGPIWMPINILLIESLQKFHYYLGDDFKVECPTGSGHFMHLWEVSQELSRRLLSIFTCDKEGVRPVFTGKKKFQDDPYFKEYILFHEYFHGDTGEGLGASHQTGWTGLIAKILHQLGEYNDN
ncbi:MAG: glucosidase [Chlamydiota bacterium]